MTILLTGATGTVGSHLVDVLHAEGLRPRALVRDRRRADVVLRGRADLVIGDLADPASLAAAMRGVDTVFLLSANHPDQVRRETNLVDAAEAAGLSRVVKMSARGADPAAANAFWRGHAQVEAHLRATGLPSVVLRSSFLMSNLLAGAATVRATGNLMAPAGLASVAMVHPADVAGVAARALRDHTIAPGMQELTGPQALTHQQVADALSVATGRRIGYLDVTPTDALAGLVGSGVPEVMARQVVNVYDSLRRGDQAATTDTVSSILGRPARPLADFLQVHAGSFTAHESVTPRGAV